MDDFFESLKKETQSEIHFDDIHKRIYSVDASIYEVTPLVIAIPKTKEDLVTLLKIAERFNVPVTARGAATGITGGSLGKGLIIDLSKYLNRIIEINLEEEYAIVEPGVVQDQLNEALDAYGYRLGPDTSTGNRATLGGMVANNSAGSRSLYYGKMSDHIKEIELALIGGELVNFKQVNKDELKEKLKLSNQEGAIYRGVVEILFSYKKEIEERFPKLQRRVSGYNLDLIESSTSFDLCKLIAGSEGTLGIATKIKLKICRKLDLLGMVLIYFDDIVEGMKSIPTLLQTNPVALEMIDEIILQEGLKLPRLNKELSFIKGKPQMIFIAEFQVPNLELLNEKLLDFEKLIDQNKIGYGSYKTTKKEEMKAIWNVRKAGLGLLLSKKTYSRAIAFIEDLSIPPDHLYSFMKKFQDLMKRFGKNAGIYGHVGAGCMHIRPYMDLRDAEEQKAMEKLMLEVTDLVLEEKGALSGEHGDGLIRSWLTEKCFGKKLTEAFLKIKTLFDQRNLMNPGKIVNGKPLLTDLRSNFKPEIGKIKTFLDFSKEGGFHLAVDLCNGNGMCRKKESVMCPSFQATSDEYDSTRARAQTLRSILKGDVNIQELVSKEVMDVLDLCLECKGCKTECPSGIDMAKIKAELLFQYQQKEGVYLRNLLFGHIGLINQMSAPVASFFNWVRETYLFKFILEKWGITDKRSLPKLANQRFSDWFKSYPQLVQKEAKKVLLFNDTFTEFNEPEIGISAVKVLNYLGYLVVMVPWSCCGRPLISKGLLKEGQKKARALHTLLEPYGKENIPIIGLEPSCILTIKDDFEALTGIKESKVFKNCWTFDEFVLSEMEKREGLFQKLFKEKNEQKILVHGHCHQKALVGMKPTLQLLKRIKGLNVKEIDSGCCGLAGSFGYEKEHYELSMKIGNLKLFPAVREDEGKSVIVANGFSCRSQIMHGTKRETKHLAEMLMNFIPGDN